VTYQRWTLRTENTSYTVRLSPDGPWAELDAWGPLGVEDGPSALDWSRRTHFITPADAAPAEYLPYGLRPFTGSELVASRPDGEDRGMWWEFVGAETDEGALRLAFHDELLGLRTVLHYETVPGTDVILRWTEFTAASQELRLERLDSAAVNIPVTGVARLTYLTGQWSQEFQRTQLDLPRGTFSIGSLQGVPGHAYAPWLAVQDGESPAAYGIALAWPGNWHITAEAEPGGAVRVRAGRVPHEGAVILAPGETLATPQLACAFSPEGLDGLSRVWHRYERHLSGERLHRPRKVLYNSWEATGFDVDAAAQLELAKTAADIGAELFVVDDGWFTGRGDDTGGTGGLVARPGRLPAGLRPIHRGRKGVGPGLRSVDRARGRQPGESSVRRTPRVGLPDRGPPRPTRPQRAAPRPGPDRRPGLRDRDARPAARHLRHQLSQVGHEPPAHRTRSSRCRPRRSGRRACRRVSARPRPPPFRPPRRHRRGLRGRRRTDRARDDRAHRRGLAQRQHRTAGPASTSSTGSCTRTLRTS
jgi:hypothetical protein